MSPNENAPLRAAQAQIVSLLPLIAGQIYALALVVTDRLGYFQFMLLNAADVWLAWLSTLFFFSSGEGVFGKRLRKFLGLNGGLFVALAFAAYAGVASDLEVGTRNQPLFRMLDLVSISLSGDLVTKGLIYMAVGLGASLLIAMTSNDPRRHWYTDVVSSSGLTLMALVLTAVLSLFVRAGGTRLAMIAVALLFSGARIALGWAMRRFVRPEQAAEDYARFLRGDD